MQSNKRYEFGGFTFGVAERFFNLRIQVVIDESVSTGTPVGFAFELTDAERLELIDLLSNVDLTRLEEGN